MRDISILAPAKLNLFFRILARRPDGFYEIESIFEKVGLCDRLTLCERPDRKIVVSCNVRSINALKRDNLVYRAAALLQRQSGVAKGVSIELEKNIPSRAGLGGGSSDAAATLAALKKLWRLKISGEKLLIIARKLGCDVALFLCNGSFLYACERGDVVSVVPKTKKLTLWHVIIVPAISVSTKRAYCLYDKHFLGKKSSPRRSKSSKNLKLTIPGYDANIIACALCNRDVSLLNYYSYNSFTTLICKRFPGLAAVKRRIEADTKKPFFLSGSGSALFTTVRSEKEARRIAERTGKCLHRSHCYVVSTHSAAG